MVILVADCYRQCAGHRLGWMSTVTHNNRDEELFLVLPVKCPQSRYCCCAVEVVLDVEVIAVPIIRGDAEVEGRPILGRVPVRGSEERGGLVQFYYLSKNGEDNRKYNGTISICVTHQFHMQSHLVYLWSCHIFKDNGGVCCLKLRSVVIYIQQGQLDCGTAGKRWNTVISRYDDQLMLRYMLSVEGSGHKQYTGLVNSEQAIRVRVLRETVGDITVLARIRVTGHQTRHTGAHANVLRQGGQREEMWNEDRSVVIIVLHLHHTVQEAGEVQVFNLKQELI